VSLGKKLIKPDQTIVKIKYFTSMVYRDSNLDSFGLNKYQRQNRYIKALRTLSEVEIFFGRHQKNEIICKKCKRILSKFTEKMTDVNIAVEIFKDAHKNNCETQILISGDTDLVPITKAIYENFDIKLLVFFPPSRETDRLKKFCYFSNKIFEHIIKTSQFADIVVNDDNFKIIKPKYWNY